MVLDLFCSTEREREKEKERERAGLLYFIVDLMSCGYYIYIYSVKCPFIVMPYVGLQCVIVAFPGPTSLLSEFVYKMCIHNKFDLIDPFIITQQLIQLHAFPTSVFNATDFVSWIILNMLKRLSLRL